MRAPLRCDIRDRTHVDDAFAAAAAANGPIHALVACSGIGGPNEDGPDDRFDDLVATNLSGTYYCARAALRQLAAGPEARHLVVISSILARIAVSGYTGYSGVEGRPARPRPLVRRRACAGERAGERDLPRLGRHRHGVGGDRRVSPRRSAATATTPTATRCARFRSAGWDEPADVAGTVAWLLSDDARGVTGQAIDQNGGAWIG